MARRWTSDEVLEFIAYLKGGDAGRGSGFGPSTGLLEAIREDREGGARSPRSSRRRSSSSTTKGMVRKTARRAYKPKRKVSAYQREFGRQLKKLKKKHPRTPVTRLMKRAHAATKRARRGK